MKYTEKFTAVPWMFDWGIAAIIAVVAMVMFLLLARESAWWKRVLRSLMGGYYVYYAMWLGSAAIIDKELAWLVLVPLFLFVAYFFAIVGHKSDVDTERRRAQEQADAELWKHGPSETHWSPEPIVGYRVSIHSFAGERFNHQPATCRYKGETHRGNHDIAMIPTWGCSCGYYAMNNPHRVPGLFKVIVLMWGRVIEHEDGYRASHMRPIGYLGHAPLITGNEPVEVSTFNSPMRTFITPVADHNLCLGFQNLPVATDKKSLDALIEKARKEFDPEYIPPYDGRTQWI
jgi:uncharacterized membrane protein